MFLAGWLLLLLIVCPVCIVQPRCVVDADAVPGNVSLSEALRSCVASGARVFVVFMDSLNFCTLIRAGLDAGAMGADMMWIGTDSWDGFEPVRFVV